MGRNFALISALFLFPCYSSAQKVSSSIIEVEEKPREVKKNQIIFGMNALSLSAARPISQNQTDDRFYSMVLGVEFNLWKELSLFPQVLWWFRKATSQPDENLDSLTSSNLPIPIGGKVDVLWSFPIHHHLGVKWGGGISAWSQILNFTNSQGLEIEDHRVTHFIAELAMIPYWRNERYTVQLEMRIGRGKQEVSGGRNMPEGRVSTLSLGTQFGIRF